MLQDLQTGKMSGQVRLGLPSPPHEPYASSAGEAIIITRTAVSRKQLVKDKVFAPDIFEFVYFARPDSVLDGVSVYRSRMAMGDLLAQEVRRVLKEKQIEVDVVIPVSLLPLIR